MKLFSYFFALIAIISIFALLISHNGLWVIIFFLFLIGLVVNEMGIRR